MRDLRHQDAYQPVGFLDDDPVKQGREILGVPILGSVDELSEIVAALRVQEIVVAIPSASQEQMQRIMGHCGTSGVSASILPTLKDNGNQAVSSSQLRSLAIKDLLGRDPVRLDIKAIQAYLKDKTVLVTGGGGSIGSELCRQVAEMHPFQLIIFDHGELNLYAIDHELRQRYPDLQLVVVLGDVKNKERVDWVFKKFYPEVVFHAAAYKHVPMVELNPAEGVSNNVAGTRMVVDAADRYGVHALFRFLQIRPLILPM